MNMNVNFAGKPDTLQFEPRGKVEGATFKMPGDKQIATLEFEPRGKFEGATFKMPEEGNSGCLNLLA